MSPTTSSAKSPKSLKGEIAVPKTSSKQVSQSKSSKKPTAATAPEDTSVPIRQKPEVITPVSQTPSSPSASQNSNPESPNSKPDPRRWIGLFILSLSLAMVIVDNTVLNIAIPTIVQEFGANLSDLQWVVSGYALVVASLLITFGRAGDIFGRRKMFMIGVVLFGVGSYLASISYSTLDLIIGNSIVEGVGAAIMLPATLALISSTFHGKERALAFAVWGAIAGAAGAFGPLLGGWLTTYYDWRWAFLINVIVAPFALMGAWLFLKESIDERSKHRFDWLGVITSSLGLFGLVFALIEGQRFGWWRIDERLSVGNWTWPFEISIVPVVALSSIVMLGLFVWLERRKEAKGQEPLLELSLFKFKGFRYGLLTTIILSLGEFGLIFVLPIFLQSARDYSAIDTGVALLPLGIAVIVGAGIAATLSRHLSPKWIITAGMVLEAIGIFTLSFVLTPSANTLTLAPGLIIYGLGIGLATTQLIGVILAEIPLAKSGVASGVNGTIRQVGTALGIAIIGTILTTQILTNMESGVQESAVIPESFKQQIGETISWQQTAAIPSQIDSKISEEIDRIVTSSVSEAAVKATEFAGVMVLIGAGLSLLIPDLVPRKPTEAAGH